MLKTLHLKNVGPAPEMKMTLAPRLNLITGDNGLGKSFLLDVAWWALTRRWPYDLNPKVTSGYPARPTDVTKPATIAFSVDGKSKPVSYESKYVRRDQAWVGKAGRPLNPGLVIYAHADGGFSVWDPARNYWKTKGKEDVQERLRGYVFSPKEVWDGLWVDVEKERVQVCKGVLSDWSVWIREQGRNAKIMAEILESLAAPGDKLYVGPELARLTVNDARDIPCIQTAYSDSVPILHASAGIRRIVGLAYMLLWSWQEHGRAAMDLGEEPTTQVVFLFDEIESHLHPRWQRSILNSVLNITKRLHWPATVQLIATTHSPLIMASAEPFFDEARDKVFGLQLEGNEVELLARPWAKQGDVVNWLVSEGFGLHQARSIDAERAIEAAEAWMRGEREGLPGGLQTKAKIHAELVRVLAGHDAFWPRWIVWVENHEGPE